jgi:hypothetical protein
MMHTERPRDDVFWDLVTVYQKNILTRWQLPFAGHNKAVVRHQVVSATSKYFAGTPRCMCKDNIKMDVKEPGREIVGWIYVAHDWCKWRKTLSREMNFQITNNEKNFLIS